MRLGENDIVSIRVETESILQELLGSSFIVFIYTEEVDHH